MSVGAGTVSAGQDIWIFAETIASSSSLLAGVTVRICSAAALVELSRSPTEADPAATVYAPPQSSIVIDVEYSPGLAYMCEPVTIQPPWPSLETVPAALFPSPKSIGRHVIRGNSVGIGVSKGRHRTRPRNTHGGADAHAARGEWGIGNVHRDIRRGGTTLSGRLLYSERLSVPQYEPADKRPANRVLRKILLLFPTSRRSLRITSCGETSKCMSPNGSMESDIGRPRHPISYFCHARFPSGRYSRSEGLCRSERTGEKPPTMLQMPSVAKRRRNL